MKVNFLNIKSITLKHKIKKLYAYAFELLNIKSENLIVNIGYVSDNAIRKLNKDNRGVDKATDVLSFPFFQLVPFETPDYGVFLAEQDPHTKLVELGDIVICENVAKQQAKDYGHSLTREICFLAVHGLLHILGFDHIEEDDEKLMNQTAEKILSKFKVVR